MSGEKKYNYWINAGIYNGLQKLSVLFFGIVSTMLLARTLSKEDMGIWTLFLTISSIVEVVRNGLIRNALNKFLNSNNKSEFISILSASFILNVIVTGLIILLIIIFAPSISLLLNAPELKNVLYIFIFGLLCLIPFSHFEWLQNAKTSFKGIFYSYFVRQAVSLLLICVLIILNKAYLNYIVLFYCIGIASGTFVSYLFSKKFLEKKFSFTQKWFLQIWHFGKFVFATNICSTIFRGSDQFFVSYFSSPAFVALQNISIRIANLADLPSQVLGDILFPKSAQTAALNDSIRIKYLFEKSVGAVLAFSIPISLFIFIFPKFILYILVGYDYYEATTYLRIILVAGLFMPFLKQSGVIMDSTGKPRFNFFVNLTITIVHLINCYLIIKHHLLIGAGIALVITQFLGFILMQLFLYKFYKINFLHCFKYCFSFYPEMASIVYQRFFSKWQKA